MAHQSEFLGSVSKSDSQGNTASLIFPFAIWAGNEEQIMIKLDNVYEFLQYHRTAIHRCQITVYIEPADSSPTGDTPASSALTAISTFPPHSVDGLDPPSDSSPDSSSDSSPDSSPDTSPDTSTDNTSDTSSTQSLHTVASPHMPEPSFPPPTTPTVDQSRTRRFSGVLYRPDSNSDSTHEQENGATGDVPPQHHYYCGDDRQGAHDGILRWIGRERGPVVRVDQNGIPINRTQYHEYDEDDVDDNMNDDKGAEYDEDDLEL